MAHIKDSPEQHEVVVIGSGAGGGTVAHVLTGLGIRVTLLEAGPMLDPLADFKEHVWPHDVDHRGAEEGGGVYFGRGEAFGHFNASAVRGGWTLEGEPYTVAKGSDFLWFRSRVVGGRTNHYGRISLRFSDYDFRPLRPGWSGDQLAHLLPGSCPLLRQGRGLHRNHRDPRGNPQRP